MNRSWYPLIGFTACTWVATVHADDMIEAKVEPELRLAFAEAIESAASFSDRAAATTWLADMSARLATRVPDPFYRIELLKLIHEQASQARLKPELVLAVIQVESKFDRFAVSRSGALGLMQIKPFWIKEIGHPRDNLFYPQTNLRYGCTILRHYLDRASGDLTQALADYNGYGNPNYADMVYSALEKHWF